MIHVIWIIAEEEFWVICGRDEFDTSMGPDLALNLNLARAAIMLSRPEWPVGLQLKSLR
jgi:hypothetical protein